MSVDPFLFLNKYCSCDNIKMNGMVGTCRKYEGQEKCIRCSVGGM